MPNKTMKTVAAQISVESSASRSLSLQDREAIMNAIATIQTTMPYLIDLTQEDRKALPKLGDGSVAFVRKATELAGQNSDFLPRSFDVGAMKQNFELWEQMAGVMLALNQLQELMDDTFVAAGSKAFTDALMVYQYAKAVADTGTLESSVVEMGQRFARKSRKKDGATEKLAEKVD
jgi:hypothetical protein